jgi:hypothetical protein
MVTPPVDNSWMNAPPLMQIAASQQGGARGAQVWGITDGEQLISNYQVSPGGNWSGWSALNWNGAPAQVLQVAACQQNDGRCQVFATDNQMQLWTTWQTSPGGGWTGWEGPNWNGAPLLSQLAATQQGGARGGQVWGITVKDVLVTCFQETPGGGWSSWDTSSFLGAPPSLDLAACQQNDGRVQIWILDQKQQLWSAWQTSPGGNWTGWSGPNWNGAQPFQWLACSQQGGSRGAQLWATDENNAVWSCYQETPGGGWSGWLGPNWNGATTLTQMAAAQQNDGRVEIWGVDMNMAVKTCWQTSPGGNWTGWTP